MDVSADQRKKSHVSPPRVCVEAGYDCWAAVYDDRDPTTLLDEPALRQWCRPLAGRRVLDLGCGTGRYTRLLAAIGADVISVDLSWQMLQRARQAGPAGGRWVQSDVQRLPFAAASFAGVASGLVVDHISDLGRFLNEVARVLTPGGLAVIVGVHPTTQRRRGSDVRFHARGRDYRMPGIIHEPSAWRAAAEQAGR